MRQPVDPIAALERLRAASDDGRLDRMCEDHGVDLLGVFGSAVRRWRDSTAPAPQDLDVMVRFRQGTVGDPLALINELMDLTGFDHVDLAIINDALPVLRVEALTGLGLYEEHDGQWAVAQMAALGEFRDTAHLRRLNLETLAG
jgi:predicted nucleotidyltransferase